MTLDNQKKVSSCKNCNLHKTRTQTVYGKLNSSSFGLIVGEAPGKEEDLAGEPFIGATGKDIEKLLKEFGLKKEQFSQTNVVKCRPTEISKKGTVVDRVPVADEYNACSPNLEKQIKKLKPKLIIAVGLTSLKFFSKYVGKARNEMKIVDYINKVVPIEINGLKTFLYVIYHPSYILGQYTSKIQKEEYRKKNKETISKVKEQLTRPKKIIR